MVAVASGTAKIFQIFMLFCGFSPLFDNIKYNSSRLILGFLANIPRFDSEKSPPGLKLIYKIPKLHIASANLINFQPT